MTGQNDYTIRQAAYDLRKLRGKELDRQTRLGPGATRSPPKPPAPSPRCSPCAITSSRPILAGVAVPAGPQARHLDPIDRDYENLRVGMQTLFRDLGIETLPRRIDNILSIG